MEGWIKLYRQSLDHWLYKTNKPKTRREAWEDMLMIVNYEPKKVLIRGQLYECGKGQSLLSLESWAEKFNWSKQQVRTFFELLKNDAMINIEGLQYTTRITICNYELYQPTVTHEKHTKQLTNTHTDNTPPTPTKESKEGKEDIADSEKSESAVTRLQNIFINWYLENKGLPYSWSAKEAKSTQSLIKKLEGRLKTRNLEITDKNIDETFFNFLKYIKTNKEFTEKFVWENLSFAIMNSQYQNITSRALKK